MMLNDALLGIAAIVDHLPGSSDSKWRVFYRRSSEY